MVGVPKLDILEDQRAGAKKVERVESYLIFSIVDIKNWGITGMLKGEIGYLHHESVHLSASAHTINLGTVTHLGISESRKF